MGWEGFIQVQMSSLCLNLCFEKGSSMRGGGGGWRGDSFFFFFINIFMDRGASMSVCVCVFVRGVGGGDSFKFRCAPSVVVFKKLKWELV